MNPVRGTLRKGRVDRPGPFSFLRHQVSIEVDPLRILPPGLKSQSGIPIFLAMHSQAVIRLKRGK
ncbi:hypothetical protein CHQ57_21180 [Aeromonas salmonicida]|nr:hypothetical protein CHQ57_21180 [Aeromonas salmonicida]